MQSSRAHASASADVRDALRLATRADHERLHGQPHLASLADGTLSRAGYTALLGALHSFYVLLDECVLRGSEVYLDGTPDYRYQPRAGWLLEDLRALGGSRLRFPTPAPQLPPVDSAAALAGMLYVVEGAVLGGAVLDRGAARVLGRRDERGRSYWAWCRRSGPSSWRRALLAIESLARAPAAWPVATRAAQQTFAVFGAILAGIEAPSAEATVP